MKPYYYDNSKDIILTAKNEPEIPPRVEYNITDYGKTLSPIIDSMYQWGRQHMKTDNKGYCDEK
ncbi:winged helix-turn-helix transcriptional regulator [Chryseobacterium mucoviscidosis]|uniref:winged helix-turn-helix transcriptional regulator n=1 Tax=Chryseobacterium mucoviscidosis TaxID=1945581 RepID=UPI003CD069B8